MGKWGVLILCWGVSVSAWEVDLSRRQLDFNRISNQQRGPASVVEEEPVGLLGGVLKAAEVSQDIVIMQTEDGFVPDSISVRKGQSYKVHVVNVNPKHRNASFIFDAFSEHHATAFGRVKSFTIRPKAHGVFTFLSPESGVQGRLIVSPEAERLPAGK